MIHNKKFYIYIVIVFILFCAHQAQATEDDGTMVSSSYTAQLCEDETCVVTSTSPVNFGYFTNVPAYNVHITDAGFTGYIWGKKFGWVVLNCANTASGCSSTNGNFKVISSDTGVLSGYAWGEDTGWVNFGPFLNTSTSPITINSNGQFTGYAWAQNFGWIKFDCTISGYCVQTDFRPQAYRSSTRTSVGQAPIKTILPNNPPQPTYPPNLVYPTKSPIVNDSDVKTDDSANINGSTGDGSKSGDDSTVASDTFNSGLKSLESNIIHFFKNKLKAVKNVTIQIQETLPDSSLVSQIGLLLLFILLLVLLKLRSL